MALKYPESMEECVYFTRRAVGSGKVAAWVLRQDCPKCGKALMSKPKGEKGKVKIRAKEYLCPECGYAAEKEAYEETLTANIAYSCPKCSFSGETQMPFKRKTYQGVKALVFECGKCGEKLAVTKKMKEPKKKKKGAEEDFDEGSE